MPPFTIEAKGIKKTREVWFPHLKKTAVKYLSPWQDPSDPPLTPEAREEAKKIPLHIVTNFGSPDLILTSTRVRAIQTAEPTVKVFSQFDCPVISLSCLGQPDSGEEDPTNTKARPDGIVIYGPESTKLQWFQWFLQSRMIVKSILSNWEDIYNRTVPEEPLILYFTHTTLVAAARYAEFHGYNNTENCGLIDDLDSSIKPYCYFEEDYPLNPEKAVWIEKTQR